MAPHGPGAVETRVRHGIPARRTAVRLGLAAAPGICEEVRVVL